MHAALIAAEAAAEGTHLPISPVAIGLIAFAALTALLAVTWAFRSIGNRH